MKKEEKSTPISSKTRSVYKYELQATNQILKDTLDIYPSSLHSTAQTNRHYNTLLEEFDECLMEDFNYNRQDRQRQRLISSQKYKKESLFHDYAKNISPKKSIQEYQLSGLLSFRQSYSKRKPQYSKKQLQIEVKVGNSSPICSFSSENQDFQKNKSSFYIDKSIGKNTKKEPSQDNKKELRRQRRGLANISLKVKNIVAKRGKMTFKQVSDEVLKESQQDLPNQQLQREKEIKNIRRRVYDALNVLVSVGILGKEQRCVVHTEFTNIPGKKLSSQWEIITEKHKKLSEQQSDYDKKQSHYQKLKKNYQLILLLHQRNKKLSESFEKRQQNTRNQQKNIQQRQQIDKYHFPLVCLVPPLTNPNKMKVQIEHDQKQSVLIKKMIIQGNELVFTDVDLLKFINLDSNLDKQQLDFLKKHIKQVEDTIQSKLANLNKLPELDIADNSEDIYLSD